ncbi:MAG: UDP-N-acetylmuramoyl-tripeptide--D-alanyl-D-alanine ligase [bacterium]
MEKLTIDDVAQATGGTPVGKDLERAGRAHPTDVSIDSRTLKKGDLFFALRGERFDGHDFVGQAFDKGAVAGVVSEAWYAQNQELSDGCRITIVVEDTLQALQELARYYRAQFQTSVVAVTGTNGKTTTKEMIARVLSQEFSVLKTAGNLNNHIGLPLTLLRLRSGHQIAVVELGMRGLGQIARLAQISDPQLGVIINVGPAHLEFFDSVDQIAEAKAELLDYLDRSSTAILNADDPRLMRQKFRTRGRTITYGLERGADVQGKFLGMSNSGGSIFAVSDSPQIELPLPGKHMVSNALAAVAVGREFGIEDLKIRQALESFQTEAMRMERFEVDGIEIINDAYNANPDSMRAAVETLRDLPCAGRRIAVLGDMLELGETGPSAHRELGKWVAQCGIDYLVAIGELSKSLAAGAVESKMMKHKVYYFASKREAILKLKELLRKGDLLLAKGSRKIGLEEVIEGLVRNPKSKIQNPKLKTSPPRKRGIQNSKLKTGVV